MFKSSMDENIKFDSKDNNQVFMESQISNNAKGEEYILEVIERKINCLIVNDDKISLSAIQ